MTRILLAAPWTALLVAGLLPWLNTTPASNEQPNTPIVQNNEPPIAYVTPTDEEVDDRKSRRNQFAAYRDKIIRELIEDKISLREFVDLLFTYCLARYPEHLDHLDNTEPGINLRVKVGNNTVQYVLAPGTYSHLPQFVEISERIRSALQIFLCEEESSQHAPPAVQVNLQ